MAGAAGRDAGPIAAGPVQSSTQLPEGGSIVPQPDDARTFANLRARAALGRYGLYQLADGTYLLTGYGALTRELPDLRSVAALLRQMGIA